MLAQLAIVLLAAGLPLGGFGEPLQPATYQSPSGAWCLVVDPTDRYGEGAADYRVSKSGDPIWSKRLPFTWRHACIDDRGFAVGSGYGLAADGMTPGGSVVIAVLSPAGEITGRKEWPIGRTAQPIGTITGLVHDAEHGRVLFRISTPFPDQWDRSFEQWCLVELHRPSFDFVRPDEDPDAPDSLRSDLRDVLPIRGRNLLATCWGTTDVSKSPQIANLRVAIVGLDGKRVAALEYPAGLESSFTRSIPWDKIHLHGLLAQGSSDATFSVWVPAPAVRIELGLKPLTASEWLIEELGREPYEPPDAPAPEDPPGEPIELRLVERVALQVTPSPEPGPIRTVYAFGCAGPGRLQLVRWEDRRHAVFSCLLIDEQGEVLFERQLRPFEAEGSGRVCWWPIGGGRWLVTRDGSGMFRSLDSVLVDAAGQLQTSPCAGFAGVRGVAGTPDGGFVVLGDHYEVRSSFSQWDLGMGVASYDATGTRRWLASLEGGRDDPNALDSSDDVAVTPSGVVAVVDPWEDALGLIGPDGTFLQRLKLNELWDHDPVYVAHIEPDGEAGFLVTEEPSAPVVHRIGLDGRIRSSFVPCHPDGARDRWLAEFLRCDTDGRLWSSDRNSLLRLDSDGKADLVLGGSRNPQSLQDPGQAIVDPLGRIVMHDQATRTLHVFDRSGARLFVAEPLPGDFLGSFEEGDVVASFDGSSFVKTQAFEEGWLGFDAGGQRMGPIDLGGRSEHVRMDSVAFTPPGPYWVHRTQDSEFALLRDEEGNELGRIERRSDRRWFEDVRSLATAPSGQVAVLESLSHSGGGSAVSWFDGSGRPIGQARVCRKVEGNVVASSDAWIAVASYKSNTIWLCRKADGRLRSWTPPEEVTWHWGRFLGFSPDGRELWLIHPSSMTLWRFALP